MAADDDASRGGGDVIHSPNDDQLEAATVAVDSFIGSVKDSGTLLLGGGIRP